MCFVCVCDVRHLDKRGLCMLLTCIRGEAWPRVPPPPFGAEQRLGYPQANFFYFSKQIFYFFLPYPIKAPIYPFSLPLRGFLFLCVYFPIRVPFRGSEGKNGGKIRIVLPPILCLCGYYTLYSHFLLFSAVILCCVFRLFLLSVLCFCIIFCCGCCVFR